MKIRGGKNPSGKDRADIGALRTAFAKALRRALKEGHGNGGRPWKQEGLAMAVGVSTDSVSNWVNARALPNEASFGLLIKVLFGDANGGPKPPVADELETIWKAAQEQVDPDTSNAGRGFAWLDHVGALSAAGVTALATLVGAILVAGLWPAKQSHRTEVFLERFEDSGTSVGQARDAVSNRLWQVEDIIAGLNAAMDSEDASVLATAVVQRDRLLGMLAHGDGTHPPLAPDLHEIVVFFETLSDCIATDACDPDTALTMLGPYADVFWTNWRGFVEDRRETQENYGQGLQGFAAMAAENVKK